mgnify:CR=1 FL=1
MFDAAIEFDSVIKRYGTLTAVDGVTLRVERGEHCALLGPNGAGKTTLVRMLMGFSRPTAGRVRLDGISSGEHGSRRNVGYLAESHRIPPHLTARRYLMRHASLRGMESIEAPREIDRVLEMVRMKDRAGTRAGTYSKGMTQRVGLAAALLGRPRILILDEPAGGLDPVGIREVRMILEELREQGTTVLLNSHLLSEVEKTCGTAAIIGRGRIALKEKLATIASWGETLEDVFVRAVGGGHE